MYYISRKTPRKQTPSYINLKDNFLNNLLILQEMEKNPVKYHYPRREEERELILRVQRGDKEAEEEIIRSNKGLVINYVQKRHEYLDNERKQDLYQVGYLALVDSARLFDLRRDNSFAAYARWRIKRNVKREFDSTKRTVGISHEMQRTILDVNKMSDEFIASWGRQPTLEEICKITKFKTWEVKEAIKSRDEVDFVYAQHDPAEPYAEVEFRLDKPLFLEKINPILENLDYRDSEIIKRRFGLDGYLPQTLEAIGKRLGYTKERVRQIEEGVLKRFRRALDLPEKTYKKPLKLKVDKQSNKEPKRQKRAVA